MSWFKRKKKKLRTNWEYKVGYNADIAKYAFFWKTQIRFPDGRYFPHLLISQITKPLNVQTLEFEIFVGYNKCTEEPDFCLNGATCEQAWTSARCHCSARFRGDKCDQCPETFQPDGCQECADGYYGDDCGKYFVIVYNYQNCCST